LVAALSVAHWSDWLIEINADSASGANGSIIGRQGLMLAQALITMSFSVVAFALWSHHAQLERRLQDTTSVVSLSGVAAVIHFLASLSVLTLHWDRGWWYHLEHGGPLTFILLSAAQVVALCVAAWPERHDTPGTQDAPSP